ncbi:putative nucleotide-binding alpha-beta plait domain superfamily [Helianthus annuus]|nr:putative nucleotide-binding alpha-beta plait domain superfamily [Helianthus annuus]KAJ0877973.1 putative nucleotide-binding alpha-beta plait domain superfamily [Helianthus annuus]
MLHKPEHRLMLQPGGTPPIKVLCLTHVVTRDELINDDDYKDITEDIKIECAAYGKMRIFFFF